MIISTMFYMRNIVGPRVKEARQRNEPPLTQSELSARLQLQGWDLQRTGVAKIELGIRQITDIELVMLANTLNVSVSWLLGFTDNII
jgi:HTH-type transcriptional regulator, cell division transcriptional repressor